jgi:flagellar FliL protein
MAVEETEVAEAPIKSGGGMLGKVIIAVVAIVLIGVGAFAGPRLLDMIKGTPDADTAEADPEMAAAADKPVDGPEIYQSLLPPLVVNIKDAYGDVHYMQLSMEAMARDQNVINAIREHTPLIRNNLILLYGSASYEAVTTREGKEQLLADGLAEIRAVMKSRIGDADVEALYFTALVIQ